MDGDGRTTAGQDTDDEQGEVEYQEDYSEYDDLQDQDYNPNNKLSGRTKRNTEKDSLGRYHDIVNTQEGSEILHQFKEQRGLGGKSLDRDQLDEVFGDAGTGGATEYDTQEYPSREENTQEQGAEAYQYGADEEYVGDDPPNTPTEGDQPAYPVAQTTAVTDDDDFWGGGGDGELTEEQKKELDAFT